MDITQPLYPSGAETSSGFMDTSTLTLSADSSLEGRFAACVWTRTSHAERWIDSNQYAGRVAEEVHRHLLSRSTEEESPAVFREEKAAGVDEESQIRCQKEFCRFTFASKRSFCEEIRWRAPAWAHEPCITHISCSVRSLLWWNHQRNNELLSFLSRLVEPSCDNNQYDSLAILIPSSRIGYRYRFRIWRGSETAHWGSFVMPSFVFPARPTFSLSRRRPTVCEISLWCRRRELRLGVLQHRVGAGIALFGSCCGMRGFGRSAFPELWNPEGSV